MKFVSPLSKENGAGDGTRTRNLLITNQLLCQLSYASSRGVFTPFPETWQVKNAGNKNLFLSPQGQPFQTGQILSGFDSDKALPDQHMPHSRSLGCTVLQKHKALGAQQSLCLTGCCLQVSQAGIW